MTTEKPLSKTAQLKKDRADRKAVRRHAALIESKRMERLQSESRELTGKVPAEFGSWGVVRTRAFMKLHEIVQYRAALKTVKADQLEPFVNQLRFVGTMPIEECARLELVDARMALSSPIEIE